MPVSDTAPSTVRADADATPLVSAEAIAVRFPVGRPVPGRQRKSVTAVDQVSLDIAAGETVALVGESGCGKTTFGRVLAGLQEPSSGQLHLKGAPVDRGSRSARRDYHLTVQMIFQDPFTSLNPRLTIRDVVSEPLRINRRGSRDEVGDRAAELLDQVGIAPQHVDRRPSAFSGGQRQRVAIARALALEPKLIVCDEPVSALDMSVQARIINLLVELKAKFGLAYLFISHDLSVVRHIADRVAVMYLGRIVELGPAHEVFEDPQHPYTQALLGAVPDPHDRRRTATVRGEVPSNIDLPPGCSFAPRCELRTEVCDDARPELLPLETDVAPEIDRSVACYARHPTGQAVELTTLGERGRANRR